MLTAQAKISLDYRVTICLLKKWCDYMLKKGLIASRAECKKNVRTIIDAMLEKGEVTQAAYVELDAYLTNYVVDIPKLVKQRRTEKFIRHMLRDPMTLNNPTLSNDDYAGLQALRNLREDEKKLEVEVMSKFAPYVRERMTEVLKTYATQFGTEFSEGFDL